MKKPTIEKKVKTVAKKVRSVVDIERRIERANELLTRQYDAGGEALHQCREATKAIMEACATVHMAEQNLAEQRQAYLANGFVTQSDIRKKFIKWFFIDLAVTAALIMVAVYGAE